MTMTMHMIHQRVVIRAAVILTKDIKRTGLHTTTYHSRPASTLILTPKPVSTAFITQSHAHKCHSSRSRQRNITSEASPSAHITEKNEKVTSLPHL
jgi:hypothetical protein